MVWHFQPSRRYPRVCGAVIAFTLGTVATCLLWFAIIELVKLT